MLNCPIYRTINIYNSVIIKLHHRLPIGDLNASSLQREILKQHPCPPRSSRRRHHWPIGKQSTDRPGVQERAGSTLRAASPVHPEDSVVVRQRRAEERPVEASTRSSLHSLRLLFPRVSLFIRLAFALSGPRAESDRVSLCLFPSLSPPLSFSLSLLHLPREPRVKTSRAASRRPSPFWYTQHARRT